VNVEEWRTQRALTLAKRIVGRAQAGADDDDVVLARELLCATEEIAKLRRELEQPTKDGLDDF
jgi:hypothetical protein